MLIPPKVYQINALGQVIKKESISLMILILLSKKRVKAQAIEVGGNQYSDFYTNNIMSL